MSRLNIHAFISFYNRSFLCLIFQARKHFFIQVIIHFIVDCVFLASMLNRIFVLLEMFSQYIATVIIRCIFPVKHDGAFWLDSEFASDHDRGTFSNQISL